MGNSGLKLIPQHFRNRAGVEFREQFGCQKGIKVWFNTTGRDTDLGQFNLQLWKNPRNALGLIDLTYVHHFNQYS